MDSALASERDALLEAIRLPEAAVKGLVFESFEFRTFVIVSYLEIRISYFGTLLILFKTQSGFFSI